MAKLSELIIQHPEVDSFEKLELLVAHAGESGSAQQDGQRRTAPHSRRFEGDSPSPYLLHRRT